MSMLLRVNMSYTFLRWQQIRDANSVIDIPFSCTTRAISLPMWTFFLAFITRVCALFGGLHLSGFYGRQGTIKSADFFKSTLQRLCNARKSRYVPSTLYADARELIRDFYFHVNLQIPEAVPNSSKRYCSIICPVCLFFILSFFSAL